MKKFSNITAKSNPKKLLYASLVMTLISLVCIVFYVDLSNPHTNSLKMQIGRYVTPFWLIINLYYWAKFFNFKSKLLIVNDEEISWYHKSKDNTFSWSEVSSITVERFKEKNNDIKITYRFTLKTHNHLDKTVDLCVNEYNIDELKLVKIIDSMVHKYEFEFLAD